MVFNLTSCAKRSRRSGFTLAEYMVATSIGLLVIAVGLAFWAYGSRTCAALFSYVDLSSASKNALDRVSQQIRNATRVDMCRPHKLVLVVPPDTGTGMVQITYDYNPTNQTLTQKKISPSGTEMTTLLTQCTNFSFAVYQRTPQYNTSELYTNAWNTNTAKVVEMKWVCVRQLTGDRNNVESQVSAKVVMRNK
jgi:hypothetical protein